MNKKNYIPLSSQASMLFSDWPKLREILEVVATFVKDEHVELDSNNYYNLLTPTQINDAIHGPYKNFFAKSIKAYLAISKARIKINIKENETISSSLGQHKSVKESKAQDLRSPISNKVSTAELDKMQHQLDEQITSHFSTWQEQVDEWAQDGVLQLTMLEISLSELEILELSNKEPLSELLNRFTNLKIKLPKIDDDKMDFSIYFQLKMKIAICSALARQHQQVDDNNVKSLFKELDNFFQQISQREQELVHSLEQAIHEILPKLDLNS